MGKILLLSIALIVILAAAFIAIMAMYDKTHETLYFRKVRKVDQLTDKLEDRLNEY